MCILFSRTFSLSTFSHRLLSILINYCSFFYISFSLCFCLCDLRFETTGIGFIIFYQKLLSEICVIAFWILYLFLTLSRSQLVLIENCLSHGGLHHTFCFHFSLMGSRLMCTKGKGKVNRCHQSIPEPSCRPQDNFLLNLELMSILQL